MLFLIHCTFQAEGYGASQQPVGQGPREPDDGGGLTRVPSFSTGSHGYLTYLVERDCPDEAVEALREEIIRVRTTTDAFQGAVDIYLEDVVEIQALPEGGLIGRYEAYPGQSPGGISSSLPGGDVPGCVAYSPVGADAEGCEAEPFASLPRHSRQALPQQEDRGRTDELLWYEFGMVDEDADGGADGTPGQVVTRLRALLDTATRLDEAGWPLRLTLTGLAFGTPLEDQEEVAGELARLGIAEFFSPMPGRTLAEAGDALRQLHDRVWYERKLVLVNDPEYDPARAFADHPDIVQGMLRQMQRIEQEGLEQAYPVEDDFDWGMVNGKLSALRWLMGDEWDDLDT